MEDQALQDLLARMDALIADGNAREAAAAARAGTQPAPTPRHQMAPAYPRTNEYAAYQYQPQYGHSQTQHPRQAYAPGNNASASDFTERRYEPPEQTFAGHAAPQGRPRDLAIPQTPTQHWESSATRGLPVHHGLKPLDFSTPAPDHPEVSQFTVPIRDTPAMPPASRPVQKPLVPVGLSTRPAAATARNTTAAPLAGVSAPPSTGTLTQPARPTPSIQRSFQPPAGSFANVTQSGSSFGSSLSESRWASATVRPIMSALGAPVDSRLILFRRNADTTPKTPRPQPTLTIKDDLADDVLFQLTTANFDLWGNVTETFFHEVGRNPDNATKNRKQLLRTWMDDNKFMHVCARCVAMDEECDGHLFCDKCNASGSDCFYSVCDPRKKCMQRNFCRAIHPEFRDAIGFAFDKEGHDGMTHADRMIDMHRWIMPPQKYQYLWRRTPKPRGKQPSHTNHLPPRGSGKPYSTANPNGFKKGDPVGWLLGLTSRSNYLDRQD